MSTAAASPDRAHAHALDEDTRPLVGATAISALLGATWVGLVLFGPRTDAAASLLPVVEPPQVVVTLAPEPPPPAPPAPPPAPTPVPRAVPAAAPATPTPARAPRRTSDAPAAAPDAPTPAPADLGAAFGGAGAPVGDVSRVLSGVRVSGGERQRAAGAGRAVIAGADEAPTGRTSPRDRAGASIGAVTAPVSGVARAEVRVSAPRAVGGGAATGNASVEGARLGSEARRRESQLRVCYTESGLRADPALAGRVTLALTLDAGGAVTAAAVTDRTWQGAGATAAEQCILERVRGWRLADVGSGGSYELSFSFTR